MPSLYVRVKNLRIKLGDKNEWNNLIEDSKSIYYLYDLFEEDHVKYDTNQNDSVLDRSKSSQWILADFVEKCFGTTALVQFGSQDYDGVQSFFDALEKYAKLSLFI